MENKLDAILKEIKSNKSVSTVTNPRSEMNDIQDMQPSGSKTNRSIGVHASHIYYSDPENDDYPLQASKMKDLKHPAKPLFRSESDVDVTIRSDEESDAEDVEDYHMVTGVGSRAFIDGFEAALFIFKNAGMSQSQRCDGSGVHQ